jgi:hypothetical protein
MWELRLSLALSFVTTPREMLAMRHRWRERYEWTTPGRSSLWGNSCTLRWIKRSSLLWSG